MPHIPDLTMMLTPSYEALSQAVRQWAASPFDLARVNYALAVQSGLLPRSQLASGRFEQQLGRLEQLALGPLARSV